MVPESSANFPSGVWKWAFIVISPFIRSCPELPLPLQFTKWIAWTTFSCFFFFVDTKGLFVVSQEDMWNMSCIWCQDMHVLLPQPPPPPFINYSQIELVQVGAKDSGRGEKKRSGECCSSVQVLHWRQTPWASPEAVCLTKILFTVSQRGCQAPISIMLPVAFCENEFHCAGDARRCSPRPLCIQLFFFLPVYFPVIEPCHLSFFGLSLCALFDLFLLTAELCHFL